MACRTAPLLSLLLLLLLLLLCAVLSAALAHGGGGNHAKEAKPSMPPPYVSGDSTNPDPLVIQLSQNAGSKNSERPPKHITEARHHSCNGNSDDSGTSPPGLTCTAICPLCPQCPPVPTCPSPCPAVPQCTAPQTCPSPCKACPACPACKRHIPAGYEHFPGLGHYRLHTVPVDWFDAKATCEREGAYLAIINSKEEADLMKRLFGRDPEIGNWLHLGFHDLYKEGKYVTLFGQPLSSVGYTTWLPGQPDNYNNNEDCGSMDISGGLNDLTCSVKAPFVCELPA